MLRGKLLNSALNSLHNFDRSLDKFLAWLSEAESSMECVEGEADRVAGRRDEPVVRQFSKQLKVGNFNACFYFFDIICLFFYFNKSLISCWIINHVIFLLLLWVFNSIRNILCCVLHSAIMCYVLNQCIKMFWFLFLS